MKVYTYSEARQSLARLLDEAEQGGEIVSSVAMVASTLYGPCVAADFLATSLA